MGVAAHRAESVERGRAGSRGGVGIRGAACRRVVQLETQPRGEVGSPSRPARLSPRSSPSATTTLGPSRSRSRRARSRARQSRRIAAAAASMLSRLVARRSISSSAHSATMFGRMPPRMTPTLTVTPGQRPLSAVRASVLCAASTIALRPRSGSTPAWAALPSMRITKSAMPLRALTMSPFSRAASRTSATSAVSA